VLQKNPSQARRRSSRHARAETAKLRYYCGADTESDVSATRSSRDKCGRCRVGKATDGGQLLRALRAGEIEMDVRWCDLYEIRRWKGISDDDQATVGGIIEEGRSV